MSIKIMAAIFESLTLAPTPRLILLALADHADDAGRCYPSIRRLCQRTGLSERAVQSNIRTLVDEGYVSVSPCAGQGGANVYIVSPTPAADAPPQQTHPAAGAPTPPQQVRPTPAADAPKPSRTIIKPSDDRSDDRPAPSFDEFWREWPLTKTGKQKAKAAFSRLSQQNRRSAIDKARQWAVGWRRAYPTASDIHPTTYLNGRRWEDEDPGHQQKTATTSKYGKL